MDACDEMGLFVIVATPGWQYWNKNPEFAKLVHRNTREMIRRDRNHPSVLMWEPILNETPYPRDFALEALRITWEEFPYPGRPVAAADVHSKGVAENYDVVYGWPGDDEKADRPEQCIFTREFGENVDDWYAHNNNNRASRSWGERPLLVQALSLSKSYDEMYRTTGQFVGGAQWHPFDHQRGYHPDPYFGGIYDAFRQPKYAYYAFRSQSAATLKHPVAECGPMVFIAHEMSPFSDADVVVFSNCDSVRLSVYDGTESRTLPVVHAQGHMPNAPVIFKDVWDFWEAREYSYKQKNWQKVNMVAEGIIDGKVVCTYKRMPSRRSTKLRMYVDTEGKQLVADGSDFIVVVAEVTDDSGNVRRLAKENIVFTVEGEGRVIGSRGKTYHEIPGFYNSWDEESSELLIACDNEFQQILKALPVRIEPIPTLLEYYDSYDARSLTRKIRSIIAFKHISAPMEKTEKGFLPDFKSRYFTEDFPFGLLIIKSIAEVLNICTPNIDKILLWGQDVLNKEYIHEGELKGKDLSKTGYINADLFYKLLKN
jgi:beta-galactosidase